jgi:hypothetical protein
MHLETETLIAAIQSVASQSELVESKLAKEQPEHENELRQARTLLNSATRDLKQAYEEATDASDGWPPYEELVSFD